MIRTIIFDLGKVLIPFDWRRGYSALAEHSPYSPEEVRARIKEAGLFDPFERGLIPPEDLARRVSVAVGLDGIGFDRFCELWSSIFLPETLLPDELLETLHRRHRLLLLSNTDVIHYRWVAARYPLLRHFDGAILSFELGCRKPEPAIYEAAVRKADCAPPEIFFTDDIEENVAGARSAGIDAVRFESREQLERELRRRGVEC